MPRYFFDIHDGVAVPDDSGRDLPSVEAARQHAVTLAAAYAREPDNLGLGGTLVVIVRDGPDSTVAAVRLVCQID